MGFDEVEDPKCPPIYFSPAEERLYCRNLRSALVVKALGRAVSYTAVSLRLNAIWEKAGIQVTSMKNGYFLVRFTNGMDYDREVMNGPWMIGPNYLTVHMWDKDFDPYNHEVASTVAWARLLEIPIQYFHQDAVMKIGRRIGIPIRIDEATRTVARSDYARVCVQVDLTKPLLSKFSINGKKYFVQYEGLEKICLNCGTYSERGACTCTKLHEPMEAEEVNKTMEPQEKQTEKTYGEWMIAKRKPRAGKKDQGGGMRHDKAASSPSETRIPGGSRFEALLVEETIETQQTQPTEMREDHVSGKTHHAKGSGRANNEHTQETQRTSNGESDPVLAGKDKLQDKPSIAKKGPIQPAENKELRVRGQRRRWIRTPSIP
ncbi:unnamed protein product [Linum trigynum]|uniref:DUF4283 domain-containing protein n=1 Tax=Linum trigynum TaxID=586398 RepID=A0AAV2ECB5_9ROSI